MPTQIFNTSTTPYSLLGDIDLAALFADAWVNCGVAGDINSSYNVSSITDKATGQIGVNFTRARANSNFIAIAGARAASGTGTYRSVNQAATTLSTTRTDFDATNTSALADPTTWSVVVYSTNTL